LKIETESALLIVKRDWRATNPLLSPPFSQTDLIKILFKVIKRSGNHFFEDEAPPPKALRAGDISYALGKKKE